MRLKVPFFGYVLAIVGLLLPSVVFVGFLPSLINTGPVKARLMAELRDWAGTDVIVAGPVSIESFFSLTVDLRNVELSGIKSVTSITSVKAPRMIARIEWTDLLRGNLDFDKVRIFDAVIHARSGDATENGAALLAALGGAQQNPFATLGISDSVVIFEGNAPQASRKLYIHTATANLRKSDGRIRVSGKLKWKGEPIGFRLTTNLPAAATPAAPVPMILDVDSRLLSGGFNGETSLKGALNAAGYLSLATPDMPGLAKWTGWPLEDGMPGVVQLTGSLNLAPDWGSLQSAAFAVGGQKATGDLTLKFAAAPAQLEGALAFDDLDFAPLWRETLGERPAAPDQPSMVRRLIKSLNMDLRISAEALHWKHAVARPAAFTLTSNAGNISAEIAELGLFDGFGARAYRRRSGTRARPCPRQADGGKYRHRPDSRRDVAAFLAGRTRRCETRSRARRAWRQAASGERQGACAHQFRQWRQHSVRYPPSRQCLDRARRERMERARLHDGGV